MPWGIDQKRSSCHKLGWLTTCWSPAFLHCRNSGSSTFYCEDTRGSVQTIATSPVDRISTQNCVWGIHDSNENILTWTSWNLSNPTHAKNAMKSLNDLESLFWYLLGLVSLLHPLTGASYQKYIHLQEYQICQVRARKEDVFVQTHVCEIVKPESLQVQ